MQHAIQDPVDESESVGLARVALGSCLMRLNGSVLTYAGEPSSVTREALRRAQACLDNAADALLGASSAPEENPSRTFPDLHSVR